MGRSPLELDDLPYGFYDVVAKREGWTERSVEVEVKDGEETVIRLKPMRPLSLVNAPFMTGSIAVVCCSSAGLAWWLRERDRIGGPAVATKRTGSLRSGE